MQDLYHQPYCYDGHDRHIAVASILTMITVIIDTVINVTVSIVLLQLLLLCPFSTEGLGSSGTGLRLFWASRIDLVARVSGVRVQRLGVLGLRLA